VAAQISSEKRSLSGARPAAHPSEMEPALSVAAAAGSQPMRRRFTTDGGHTRRWCRGSFVP
ncbi:hypothetical protein KUCAC02_006462, partial [Chaenocephalus aceratus]